MKERSDRSITSNARSVENMLPREPRRPQSVDWYGPSARRSGEYHSDGHKSGTNGGTEKKNQGARGARPGSEGKYGIVIVVKVVVVVDFAEMAAAVELTV